jgi:hypothetical protein
MVGLGESVGGGSGSGSGSGSGGGSGGGRAESEGKRLELHYKKAKDTVVVLKCEHSFTRRSLRCAIATTMRCSPRSFHTQRTERERRGQRCRVHTKPHKTHKTLIQSAERLPDRVTRQCVPPLRPCPLNPALNPIIPINPINPKPETVNPNPS